MVMAGWTRATHTRVPLANFVWLHGEFRQQYDTVHGLGYFQSRIDEVKISAPTNRWLACPELTRRVAPL